VLTTELRTKFLVGLKNLNFGLGLKIAALLKMANLRVEYYNALHSTHISNLNDAVELEAQRKALEVKVEEAKKNMAINESTLAELEEESAQKILLIDAATAELADRAKTLESMVVVDNKAKKDVDLVRLLEGYKADTLKIVAQKRRDYADAEKKKKEYEAKCEAKQREKDAFFKKSQGLSNSLRAEKRRCDELRDNLKTVTACKTRLEGEIKETEEALKNLQLDLANSKTEYEKFKGEAAEALKGMEQRPEVAERVRRMKIAIAQDKASKETTERDLADLKKEVKALNEELKDWATAKEALEKKVKATKASVQELETSLAASSGTAPTSSSGRELAPYSGGLFGWNPQDPLRGSVVPNQWAYGGIGGALYSAGGSRGATSQEAEDGDDVLARVMAYQDKDLVAGGADTGSSEPPVVPAVNEGASTSSGLPRTPASKTPVVVTKPALKAALKAGFAAASKPGSGSSLAGFRIPKKTRKLEKIAVDTQCFDLYTEPGKNVYVPDGPHDGQPLNHCECGEAPASLGGKTKHGVIQGYHQVRDFHSQQVPSDTAPFVIYDTVADLHKGQAHRGGYMSANLTSSTVVHLSRGRHFLLIDLTYASRIQIAPRERTIRLSRDKVRGHWERMDERQIPPVQDWQHHGRAFEEHYGCVLWHASFKGQFLSVCTPSLMLCFVVQ
jgi:predicted  nucleic acid-binding Zn-ribbon protein